MTACTASTCTLRYRDVPGVGPYRCSDGIFYIAASRNILEPLTADEVAHLDMHHLGGRNERGMMVGRFPKQAGVDTVALDDDVDNGGSDG